MLRNVLERIRKPIIDGVETKSIQGVRKVDDEYRSYTYIKKDPDFSHLLSRAKYRRLYEEVGTVDANKNPVWREEWMNYFRPLPGRRILELGSHNGCNLLYYGQEGFEIDGVELSSSLIAIFEAHKKQLPDEVQNRIRVFQGWIEEFFTSDRYDYVLCTEILEHVIDPLTVLVKAEECLKLGGEVYISSPEERCGNNTHVRGVPPNELKIWLSQARLSPIKLWVEEGRTFCHARKDLL
jgi:2-polyprenyl-3-methyl-5-hydroxy-6-metoxy-1,4-benzoquinol methylase